MNTTTKPFLVRSDAGFTIEDGGEEHIFCSTFAEARRILVHLHAEGMSVSAYLDSFYDDGPWEPTCPTCDGYHAVRSTPMIATTTTPTTASATEMNDSTKEPIRPPNSGGTSTKWCANPPGKRKHWTKRGNKKESK